MQLLVMAAVEADLAWQIQALVAMIARPTHDNFVGGIAIIEKQAFTAPLPLSDEDGTPRRPAPAAIVKKVQICGLAFTPEVTSGHFCNPHHLVGKLGGIFPPIAGVDQLCQAFLFIGRERSTEGQIFGGTCGKEKKLTKTNCD
jgi:hypothetical protein